MTKFEIRECDCARTTKQTGQTGGQSSPGLAGVASSEIQNGVKPGFLHNKGGCGVTVVVCQNLWATPAPNVANFPWFENEQPTHGCRSSLLHKYYVTQSLIHTFTVTSTDSLTKFEVNTIISNESVDSSFQTKSGIHYIGNSTCTNIIYYNHLT